MIDIYKDEKIVAAMALAKKMPKRYAIIYHNKKGNNKIMGKVTSVKFDAKTADLLDQLKAHYGCSSKAEVLRKAVAFLSLAAAAEDDGANIFIIGKDENGNNYQKQILVS